MTTATFPGLFETADREYRNIKRRCNGLKEQIAADAVDARTLTTFHDMLTDTWATVLSDLDGLANLNSHAAVHLVNPPADYAQDFADIKAAGQAVATYIRANLPADGNGRLLISSFEGTPPKHVYRTFTAAQLSNLDGLLDALIAALG